MSLRNYRLQIVAKGYKEPHASHHFGKRKRGKPDRNLRIKRALRRLQGSAQNDKSYQKLTSRELEILLLICQELSPGEISERLQISEKTFFNHRANILAKVNCRGNVGLVKFAHEKGLLHLSKPVD